MTRSRTMASPANAMGQSSSLLPPASAMSIPETERVFFENRLGVDFSHVRVHTDEAAVSAAETLGAKAFTIGSDIAFAEGRYQPGTTEGRRLLAHELTHVAQQSRGSAATTNAESRAHAAADQVAQGSSVSAEAQGGASTGVQCDDDEKKKEDVTPAPTSTPTPAATPAATPSATTSGVSFGAAGLTYPGLSSGFQLTPPQLGTPQLSPPSPFNLQYSTLMPPGSLLPPGFQGPLPLPKYTPPYLEPPAAAPERNIDWLALQRIYLSRGSLMTEGDAEAIMKTWDMNAQLLSTFGITDRFKFLFITKEWIMQKGLETQVEDLQIRENPNAIDKMNTEFKRAYPGGWQTPIIPIFSTDWFLKKSKK
ncbi:MAG: DUF4157 domain-containing protein [Pyrinomonadaceae bacterium]